MPVADHFVAARVHVHARLAREEEHYQRRKEHHVAGQRKEYKEADALEALTGPFSWVLPVVVTAATPSAGRSTIDWGLAANSGFFPFYFRWGAAKRDGHGEASVCVR
jgi:hypothetical protein